MSVNTAGGTRVYIGPVHAAATDTTSEYAALTWVEVSEVESVNEIGDESSVVTFASLADTRLRKLKGTRDAGTAIIVVGKDPFDVGQIAMKAAEKTKFDYNIKIELADKLDANDTNTIFYFAGPVLSQRDNIGANDHVVRTTFNVGVNTPIIEVPATAVP